MNVVTDHGPFGESATFSACRRFRYALRRRTGASAFVPESTWRSVVFLMLNPSTADAFKSDPTITRCLGFAGRWGIEALDVVNLFALRSPHPADLFKHAKRPAPHDGSWPPWRRNALGADSTNDQHILASCAGAYRVIAAWGAHGDDPRLGHRATAVLKMLKAANVKLYHLGLTKRGAPTHPLARGRHRIPDDREPTHWVV